MHCLLCCPAKDNFDLWYFLLLTAMQTTETESQGLPREVSLCPGGPPSRTTFRFAEHQSASAEQAAYLHTKAKWFP